MSFKCCTQYNTNADTEWKLASTWPCLVWCSLKSKWVKPFLLKPYIIWPFVLLKSSYKTVDEGCRDGESKTDSRKRREEEDFTLGCQTVLLPKRATELQITIILITANIIFRIIQTHFFSGRSYVLKNIQIRKNNYGYTWVNKKNNLYCLFYSK